VYCITVVSAANAGGRGQEKDDSLVHTSFEVNEYLVKASFKASASTCF